MADKKLSSKATAESDDASGSFSADEKAAMKERAAELREEKRRAGRADKAAVEEAAVVAKIAEMGQPDRALAEKFHAIVKANAPQLQAKLWYSMPAYAKDGQIVCFFQAAEKFKVRYCTIGFNDAAKLDDGNLWPTAFAVTKLTKADEQRLAGLVKRAVA